MSPVRPDRGTCRARGADATLGLLTLLLIFLYPLPAFPEVTGIVIASRTELPGGYEKVVGRVEHLPVVLVGAGIRLPDVAVPLATYTGWNFRKPADGGADQLVPLTGSFLPFPATSTGRARDGDPRRSVLERYGDRSGYLNQVRRAAQQLVAGRFLLAGDVDLIVERAGQMWDLVTAAPSTDSH